MADDMVDCVEVTTLGEKAFAMAVSWSSCVTWIVMVIGEVECFMAAPPLPVKQSCQTGSLSSTFQVSEIRISLICSFGVHKCINSLVTLQLVVI